MSTVSVKPSDIETKGWLTFRAAALNRACARSRPLPEGGLKQDLIEELFQKAVTEGYDRGFEIKLHPEDFMAYNDPMNFRVVTVLNLA